MKSTAFKPVEHDLFIGPVKRQTWYVSSTKDSCGVYKRRRKKDEKVFISFTVGGNGRLSAGWMRICGSETDITGCRRTLCGWQHNGGSSTSV